MFYIRPPARIMPSTAVKPIGTNDDSVKEEELAVSKPEDAPFIPTPANERRKRRDRRNASRDALLETRSRKDRRKSDIPSISITV